MTTKYFIDAAGRYIGGFAGTAPPVGSIEVSYPPDNANMRFNGSVWGYTLPEVKATKLASLEQSRDAAIATLPPVTVAGKQYPATPGYREIVSNLARRSSAGKPIPATLRGADGVPVTLTLASLGQLDDAISAAVQSQYDKWGTKFDSVQAATTVEAVALVVW